MERLARLTFPRLEEERHPHLRVRPPGTPSPELQAGALALDAQLVHAVAGVQRVGVAVHPAAPEACDVGAVGMEVECHREVVLVEWARGVSDRLTT